MNESWVWIPIIATAGFYVATVMVVAAVVKGRQAQAQMRAEVQTRMIDKFGTAPEFITFLQSPAGKQFVQMFEETPRLYARERVLGGLSRSIILSLLGASFLVMSGFDADIRFGFMLTGFLLLALGVGSLIAAYVSFRISRAWGLIPERDQKPAELQTMQP